MIDLIELPEVKSKLGYNDRRAVVKWCIKNKVAVFHIGKKIYLMKKEFEAAFYRPVILYQHNKSIEKSRMANSKATHNPNMHPHKTEYEKRFLEKLSKELGKISSGQ